MNRPVLRQCRACGDVKILSEFRRHHNGDAWGDAYRKDCKACMSKALPKLANDLKKCCKCGEVKPKNVEHFRSNGRQGTNFKPMCRACEKGPVPISAPKGMMYCKGCGLAKPASTEFFHRRNENDSLRGKCKKCMHAETQAHAKANVERTRATRRALYSRNPDKFRLKNTVRNRRKKETGNVKPHDVALKLQQQGRKCYWCAVPLIGSGYHIDHIIPISKGGPHTPGNICCACSHCNLSKSAKMPYEFAGRLF